MSVAHRERSLLKLVDDERDEACRRILAEAERAAGEALRQVHRKEREHLRRRVNEERTRIQSKIQAVEAERVTRERRQQALRSADILAQAWPLVRAELLARWRDPAGRQRWVARSLRDAARALPAGPWTVRHAAGWPATEQQAVRDALARELGVEPHLRTEPDIAAGLVIDSGGAVLDASLDGLLADRPRLEARLLAILAGEDGS